MTAFAAALSEHPTPAEAVGEVVGEVLEQIGPAPDLAVVFLSRSLAGAAEDIAAAVKRLLHPGCLIGAAASSVVGGGRETDTGGPAIALWAANVGEVAPVHITAVPAEGGVRILGVPTAAAEGGPRTLVLLADPFTLPLDAVLANVSADMPELTVVGGLASAARGPGGSRLVIEGHVVNEGAVGALLPPGVNAVPVVSPGSRPIGEPMIVTATDGPVLLELAGQPALDRLLATAAALDDVDRAAFEVGPQVGIVVDEGQVTFGPGDFLVRDVTGADPDRRGIVVGAQVPVGTTVQLHVRDAAHASRDLLERMATVSASDPRRGMRGALVFTCVGRGPEFFGDEAGDARTVDELWGPAVAGMACAAEIGPIAGVNRVQGYTASVLVLDAPDA